MDMENKNIKQTAVGQIVADEFATARVFRRYGIDFCCHGNTPLAEACAQAGIDVDTVIGELSKGAQTNGGGIPFASWPLDLLIDYVLKIHHRGIREKGPGLLSLIRKVREAHGANHPELYEIDELMRFSLAESSEPSSMASMAAPVPCLILYSQCVLLPWSHIWSRMGIRDFPCSERLYSNFGRICGYSS